MNREQATRQWYQDYHGRRGADRNDLRTNRGVLFQTLALEASVVVAAYAIEHDPQTAAVLDVGCGGGGDLYQLVRLKYDPVQITGIDILPDRLAHARRLYPQARFILGDASHMEFASASFDLVFESTMFATLTDELLSAAIAREMLRVCKPGGYLMLVDWWTPKPRDPNYRALTRRRLHDLFQVGSAARLVGEYRGALVPPVGRFLSKYLPGGYFPVTRLLPFLVGQVAYLLQRTPIPVAGRRDASDGAENQLKEECRYAQACV
jgi:ubiquinone/menaquinone biosynthesis C-methylase UbiE